MNKELPIGKTLDAGRYVIKNVLGTGGFSVTYLVENRLGKRFTVKEFFVDGHGKREADGTVSFVDLPERQLISLKEKFETEGRLLLKLEPEKHRNIVSPVEFFSENNTHYLVLEYIEGKTLSAIVQSGGPLRMREASAWMKQIGAALHMLHRHGIFHLDVKPANIIIDAQGQAVLIDFGLCKEVQNRGDGSLTTLAYSNGYAPPEQESGKGKPNARMDIYAFAATCHFMLTGQKPETPGKVVHAAFSGNDQYLAPALAQGLNTDPAGRQDSVYAFLNDLKLLGDERTTLLNPSITTANKPKKISQVLMALLAVAVCLFLVKYFLGEHNGKNGGQQVQEINTGEEEANALDSLDTKPVNAGKKPLQATSVIGNTPSDGKPSKTNDPVVPPAIPQYAHTWQGKIQKTTGNKAYHLVKLEYNKGNNGTVNGVCTVSEPDNPAVMAKFKITGYSSSDGETENLQIKTTSVLEEPKLKFCQFSGDFSHKVGTDEMKARFRPGTGTASSNSCSPYRTNSDFVLKKK